MAKVSGNTVIGTPKGLSRIEDLTVGTVDLYGVKRENGTCKTGFYPFRMFECVNEGYEFHLKDPYVKLNTSPDSRVIIDMEPLSRVTVEHSRGIKIPLVGFQGVPTSFNWDLDLSLVSDCEDAKVIDIRDSQFNLLMMLVLTYGYATEEGGVSLPMELKPTFQELFKEYNFEYIDNAYVGSHHTYFRTSRTAITDFILFLFNSNKELPDEIVFKVDERYFKYLTDALITIGTHMDISTIRPKPLDNFFRSLNYIALRYSKTLTYYQGTTIVEPLSSKRYRSYTKARENIKMMYELSPIDPNTYLVAEGVLLA